MFSFLRVAIVMVSLHGNRNHKTSSVHCKEKNYTGKDSTIPREQNISIAISCRGWNLSSSRSTTWDFSVHSNMQWYPVALGFCLTIIAWLWWASDSLSRHSDKTPLMSSFRKQLRHLMAETWVHQYLQTHLSEEEEKKKELWKHHGFCRSKWHLPICVFECSSLLIRIIRTS